MSTSRARTAANLASATPPSPGVEVDDHPVRFVQLGDAAEPDVWRDAPLVRDVNESRGVVTDDMGDGPAHLGHGHPMDPVGEMRRDRLLVDRRAAIGPRKPLDRDRPAAQVGQHHLRDAVVVLHDLALGDVRGREEQAIVVGDGDRSTAGTNFHCHEVRYRLGSPRGVTPRGPNVAVKHEGKHACRKVCVGRSWSRSR